MLFCLGATEKPQESDIYFQWWNKVVGKGITKFARERVNGNRNSD